MRQSVNKRTMDAKNIGSVMSALKRKPVSRLSFSGQSRLSQKAASLHQQVDVQGSAPEEIVRRLSASLAGFEVLIVPGLDGSARHHWQSSWQRLFRANGVAVRRVTQANWSKPDYENWVTALVVAVKKSKKPVLLVGHSLGCLLITHAIKKGLLPETVAGALLVAPADVENGPELERYRVAAFSPVPLSPLPFPSVVVGSRNDPWLSVTSARKFARHWSASFVDAGRKGHIGNQSDLGDWLDGLLFLDRLTQTVLLEKTGLSRHQKRVLQ